MKSVSTLTALAVRPGENQPRVSSLKIAEAFEKNHKDILRGIQALTQELPSDFDRRNFAPISYDDQYGREQPAFLLTRDAFCLLVMGFTGAKALAWKVRYIEAFNEMERRLLNRRLNLAARLTPERRREIKRAARYRALGLSCADVGKLLGHGETKARNLLAEAALLEGGPQ